MKLGNLKTVNFFDIADIDRAKKNQIYPKDSIIIQISATKGQIYYLDEDQEVEDKYAVITPKGISGKYLFLILEYELPKFLWKCQTGINIQPDIFKFLTLKIHKYESARNFFVNVLWELKKMEEETEREIKELEEMKEYHLCMMFPRDD